MQYDSLMNGGDNDDFRLDEPIHFQKSLNTRRLLASKQEMLLAQLDTTSWPDRWMLIAGGRRSCLLGADLIHFAS